jgi:Leucine-rich repeat (LRR) protein
MNLKNLLIIWTFLYSYAYALDCPKGFIKINDKCYYEKHIRVLKDFIDQNSSLYKIDPLDLGYQEWRENKLINLYLGNMQIDIIPKSIDLLKDIKNLDISNNSLLSVPENLCNIYPYYINLNLSNNEICPPYPYCFEYIDNQNNNNCSNFKCNENYINIDGLCYYKEHISVLENIIESNSSLKGSKPLEVGSEIGFQKWSNGKLTHLNLVNNRLTKLPEAICSIYSDLDFFNVSNNYLCPPYPPCFDLIGFQNTSNCIDINSNSNIIIDSINNTYNTSLKNKKNEESLLNIDGWQASCPDGYVKFKNQCFLQSHVNILQDFIDHNTSLNLKSPLEIGFQDWKNSKLVSLNLSNMQINIVPDSIGLLKDLKSLDLSNNNISSLPESACSINLNNTSLNLYNNQICSPYPSCFDYVSGQNSVICKNEPCPNKYKKINDECVHNDDLEFLSTLIDSNKALSNFFLNASISEAYNKIGYQSWKNGRLDTLIIQNAQLVHIPENICKINASLNYINFDNNSICPKYPSCYINFEKQDLSNCNIVNLPQIDCPDSCIFYYNKCYFLNDLYVLNDFIIKNKSLINYHPLSIGSQLWKNNKIQELNFNGMQIDIVPESIYKLDSLKNINLANNNLSVLPENFCHIYPKLKSLNLSNNKICAPYISCFDFIGNQNSEDCKDENSCSFGYTEINNKCYYKKDLEILKQFVNKNNSLININPLEIGVQKWNNMQLEYLYLGENELTTVPESICSILPQLKVFNVSKNNICSLYPPCVERFIIEQNKSNCE